MPIARFLLLLCLLAGPLSAQLRPVGSILRVGEGGWDSLVLPQVSVAPSGDFLVVWTSFDDDVLDAAILSRLYRRSGVPATEAPVRIDAEGDPEYPVHLFPRVAQRLGGAFTVLWSNADRVPCYGICDPPFATFFQPMSARLLDPSGNPESGPFPVGDEKSEDFPRFVLDFPSGETLFLWTSWKSSVWITSAQRYEAGGRPLSEPFEVVPGDPKDRIVGAAALPDKGFLILWARLSSTFVRRYGPAGEPIGAEIPIDTGTSFLQDAAIVAQRDGSFAVAWTASGAGPDRVFLRLVGPGAPAGNLQVSPPSAQYHQFESLAADGRGNVLVVWQSLASYHLQLHGRNGAVQGGPIRVDAVHGRRPHDAAVATNGRGDWVMVWSELSGAGFEVFAQRLREDCSASPTRVCLADGRFSAEVSWKDHAGGTGAGQARQLTDDTGAFWFFGEDNIELVIKVLDGREINGYFWVFSAGLTDVEHDLTIRDTLTGEERVYHNPARTLASRADTRAFSDPGPPPPAEPGRQMAALPAHPPVLCSAGEDLLCLQDGTFQVEVEFVDPRTGATRQAKSLPLTDESGAFWFFGEENVELFVKVLDGRAVNGHFWVFHGALTDIEYTLRIFDGIDGHRSWSYHNPRGRLHSGADTRAF